MAVLAYILGAVVLVSVCSLIGIITLIVTQKKLGKILFVLVSFAAGAMLAAAFFDLIPEALEHAGPDAVFLSVMAGIVAFFVLETFLFWYHAHGHEHTGKHRHHHKTFLPIAYLNLIGDAVHNFLDGVIIATSFLASIPLGIVASLAVIFHEIPQEIGDFSILIYGGFSRGRALFFNFLSALTAVLGALAAYYLGTTVEHATEWLVPFAAGGFIYIAAVDLLPELRKSLDVRRSLLQLLFFGIGVLAIWLVTKIFAH